MKMWAKHPFFKYITGAILVLLFAYLFAKLDLFTPLKTIISTLFYPILIAGFLFYILRPIVRWLAGRLYLPVSLAILVVFGAIGGLGYAAFRLLSGTIKEQVNNISKLPQQLKETAQKTKENIEQNDMGMISTHSLTNKITHYFGGITQTIGDHLTQIVSALTGMTTVLVIVPFVLFYFLKDGDRLVPFLLRAIPEKHVEEGKSLLRKIDQTLAAYTIGQVTVAIVDGILMYIGYLIIGLDYGLILAIFVTLTAVVPFFGPIIGIIPAIVVALMQDPMMAIYVLGVMVIVQQLEGNLVAPVVLGSKLNLHPLTIIFLLIVAAALKGFVGMLIAIPLYSVIKVLVKYLYHFFKLRSSTE